MKVSIASSRFWPHSCVCVCVHLSSSLRAMLVWMNQQLSTLRELWGRWRKVGWWEKGRKVGWSQTAVSCGRLADFNLISITVVLCAWCHADKMVFPYVYHMNLIAWSFITHTHTHTHTRTHTHTKKKSTHSPILPWAPSHIHTHAHTLWMHKRQPPYPLPLTVEYFTASEGEYDENGVIRPSLSHEAPKKKEEEEVASTTKLQLQFAINEVCEP